MDYNNLTTNKHDLGLTLTTVANLTHTSFHTHIHTYIHTFYFAQTRQ